MIHSYNNAIPSIDSILGMSCPEIGFLRQTPSPFSDSETDDDLAILSHSSSHSHSHSFFDSNETLGSPAPQAMSAPIPSSSDSAPISQPQSVALVPVVKTEPQAESVKAKVHVKKEKSSLKLADLKTAKAAEKFVKKLDDDELRDISNDEIKDLDDKVQEVIKKARRRLQNREASQTCRNKKKQQFATLQQEVQKLSEANKKLQGLSSEPASSSSSNQIPSTALVPVVKTEPLDVSVKREVEVKPEPAQKKEKKHKKKKPIVKKEESSLTLTDLKAAKASTKELARLPLKDVKKLDDEVQEVVKKERRRLQNRRAAQDSRNRKKQYFEQLAQQVAKLTEENKKLHAQVQELSAENKRLKAQATS